MGVGLALTVFGSRSERRVFVALRKLLATVLDADVALEFREAPRSDLFLSELPNAVQPLVLWTLGADVNPEAPAARPAAPAILLQARGEGVQRLQALGATVLLSTVFRHVGSDSGPDHGALRERIRRLNLGVAEISRQTGALVADWNRALAHHGARALKTDWTHRGSAAARLAAAETAAALLRGGAMDSSLEPERLAQALTRLEALVQEDGAFRPQPLAVLSWLMRQIQDPERLRVFGAEAGESHREPMRAFAMHLRDSSDWLLQQGFRDITLGRQIRAMAEQLRVLAQGYEDETTVGTEIRLRAEARLTELWSALVRRGGKG
jgi:hypothetical protein